MKPFQSKLRVLALAVGSLAISALSANAANSFYAPGDLVMYFQQEGGTNTVYANLGNAATLYRGAATGVDVANNLNFLDINSALVTAFGAGWASDTTIYAGLAGVWGTNATNNSLQDGDPHRTLYVSAARGSVGTIGTADSTQWIIAGNTQMTNAASGIQSQNNVLENSYTTAVAVSDTATSQIDDQNPFLAPGIQNDAFGGNLPGGVQQAGTAGTFAADFGGIGPVEFALDLYRIQAKNTISGQVGFGETLRAGTYEGTFTVGTDGKVSFVTSAVPEPSTYALMGLSALMIGYVVRRRRAAQNL